MKPEEQGRFLAKLTEDVCRTRKQVVRLYDWRRTHRRLVEVFKDNSLLRDEWTHLHTFIFSGYTAQACLSLRRLMDKAHHEQSVSVANIVKRLCDHPEIITRCDYVDRRRGAITKANCPDELPGESRDALDAAVERHTLEEADREYDAYSGPGGCQISKDIVGGRGCDAQQKCDAVLRYVDKRLAHYDRKNPCIPSWGELDDAIDAVGDLFCYVSLLVTGSASKPGELAGTWQGEGRDWEELLRIPWVSAASGEPI